MDPTQPKTRENNVMKRGRLLLGERGEGVAVIGGGGGRVCSQMST